jgi:hypothetical protein
MLRRFLVEPSTVAGRTGELIEVLLIGTKLDE